MKAFLIPLILLFTIATGFSQEKLEKEYRIKQSEVPLKALEFIQESFGHTRIKWYAEESLDGKAIEAKVKYGGNLYSVEFATSGMLQDVEMMVNYNTLPAATKAAIEGQLGVHFSKYRIQKTQIQWLGDPKVLSLLIKKETPGGRYVTNYEITLKGTKDRRTEYYEFLLSESGDLILKSKIIERNSHNLIH